MDLANHVGRRQVELIEAAVDEHAARIEHGTHGAVGHNDAGRQLVAEFLGAGTGGCSHEKRSQVPSETGKVRYVSFYRRWTPDRLCGSWAFRMPGTNCGSTSLRNSCRAFGKPRTRTSGLESTCGKMKHIALSPFPTALASVSHDYIHQCPRPGIPRPVVDPRHC